MEKIKITCDSTCDLTQELYEKYNVAVMPLGVTLGDELHYDGVDVSAQEIFAYVEETGKLPKTSAASIGEYMELFQQYTEQGYTVIHISISSELSSSYQNACLAAEEIGHVHVVDSHNLSTGSGYLAIMAAELMAEGLGAEEIVAKLDEAKAKLDVSFVLQTLDYLKKGGRCSSIVALGANMLSLRPEIEVDDGKMHVGRKYRGKMERSICDYVKGRLAGREDVDLKRIFVTHSYVPDEVVQKVIALVKELHPFTEVIETKAGCTISCHCGPACLGVLFFKK